MSNWNKRIRAAREAQKMTREMVVQKMQQFLPESEKAVSTRSLMSWEAGEREPRVTVGVALAKALGFEDVAVLYLDSEPKLNQAGQQRLGNTDPCCCTRQRLPRNRNRHCDCCRSIYSLPLPVPVSGWMMTPKR